MEDSQVSTNGRRGEWAQAWTGRQFWPLDPRPGDIDIEDIAHGLARVCRYGGHVNCDHYSVAQHSVLVSRVCPPWLALVGLLHDATEAYLGDVIRPLKRALPEYKHLEDDWAAVIGEAFGLGDALLHLHPDVKRADLVLLATERRDLITPGPSRDRWSAGEPPMAEIIVPQSAQVAELDFLARFGELTKAIVHAAAPAAGQ